MLVAEQGSTADAHTEAALAYVQHAQDLPADITDVPAGTTPRAIHHVGVIGAGTMGSGIATSFLSAGIPVVLTDTTQASLDRGVAAIGRNFTSRVRKGRMTAAQGEEAQQRLTATVRFEDLTRCDLIVEAVYEDMGVKLDLFRSLGSVAKPGAVLASNTSFLNIDQLGEASGRSGDVVGMHFFSPAHVMKLVEVVRGRQTAPDTLLTAVTLAKQLGKVPVVCGVCYGFIGNRMLMQRQVAASAMLLEGALPEEIDAVHTGFGMPMGPFGMADLAGLDIGWHRDPSRVTTVVEALCARGRWGQKTGAGFYDYLDGRTPVPSAITRDIVTGFRAQLGAPARAIGPDEIVARTLYTMVNEGAKILEENIAQRASDIDAVWVHGFGWPAAKGGPMYWADSVGLEKVVAGLERYRDRLPAQFTLSPLLRSLAHAGRSFLNE